MSNMEIIGKMCLVDNYIWCSCKQQLVTVAFSPYQQVIPVLDDTLHCYDGQCEMEGQCFNYDCEYNSNCQVSTIKEILGDNFDLDDEKIEKLQSNLRGITDEISKDLDLVNDLNSGGCISNLIVSE